MNLLLAFFIISVTANLAMFVIAFYLKTDKLTDISYALTFVILALIGLINANFTFTAIILTFMICLWAARLGVYLLQRIRRIGKDKRFDGRRENFWSFLSFWLLQGITVWVVMLPSNLSYTSEVSKITIVSVIGITLWIAGLVIETVADYQKYKFINDSNNKGKWIDTGLWKYSRHPNYFGEIALWIGIYLFTLPGLSTLQAFIGLLGPVYIASLIMFVSGIPLLEKSSDARWGNDKNYQMYKKRTSVLVLLPNSNDQ